MVLEKARAVGRPGAGFSMWDDMGRTRIVQILVSTDSRRLLSLQFTYLKYDGKLHVSEIMGSFTGHIIDVIRFKGGSEFVTKVEGIYGCNASDYYCTKLSIHTNLQVYNVFQAADGLPRGSNTKFSFNFGGLSQFGGFHGSHTSTGIQTIGVYYDILHTLPPKFKSLSAPKHEVED